MAVPTPAKIAEKKRFRLSLEKKLGDGKMSDKEMCQIIRSSVRKSWFRSPTRLLALERVRISDMDPDTRTLWLFPCTICKGHFKGTDVQVDHMDGEHQLLSLSDATGFAQSILNVHVDALQVLCLDCHGIKTYAERYNMSFEAARLEKQIISWFKPKSNTTAKQKKFLLSVGFSDADVKNGDSRKNSYRAYLKSK